MRGAFIAVCLLAGEATAAPLFLPLGDLPGGDFESVAQGVSADGSTVVGWSTSSSGTEAFRWSSGAMTGLGDLPGGAFSSRAWAVSADGSAIVGQGAQTEGCGAFRWTSGGGMTALGCLPLGTSLSHASTARGVSADGSVVVGVSSSASTPNEAFRWTAGGMVGLGDFSGGGFHSVAYDLSADGSAIVGASSGSPGTEAFRWTAGGGMLGLGTLPGDLFASSANAISADGLVVAGHSSSGPSGDQEAFRWASGVMVGLGDLPGGLIYSAALDISADGSVVVGQGDAGLVVDEASVSEAFVWDPALGMRNLRDVLGGLGIDMTGWTLVSASGVADNGLGLDNSITIVGTGTNPSGFTEAWLVQIPEPATAWLLASALAGLAAMRRAYR